MEFTRIAMPLAPMLAFMLAWRVIYIRGAIASKGVLVVSR